MTIKNKFDIEQFVYLIHDKEQSPRMVTGIMVRSKDNLVYELSHGTEVTDHREMEISFDENTVTKVS